MLHPKVIKFCRLNLGMKPILDYAQSRQRMMGIADLPIRTIFDIGANVGKKARQYRRMFPESVIHCFEPVPSTFARLHAWARGQDGYVRAYQLALGSKAGLATMRCNESHPGGSSLAMTAPAAGERYVAKRVCVDTLDSVARRVEVRDQVFVKIDVEGFDMEVVKGGTELLRRAAAVVIEIGMPECPDGLPGFRDFLNVMDELGYVYRGNLAHGFVGGIARLADAVFIKPPAARRAAA